MSCIFQELFLTLYESLPLVGADPDTSSKRGSSYKFASGKRVLGFLNFLASPNCFNSSDLNEVFEKPQGFKIETLKGLYQFLVNMLKTTFERDTGALTLATLLRRKCGSGSASASSGSINGCNF